MSFEKSAIVHDEELPAPLSESNHVAGDALLVAADGHIRKLPIPSNDPNDPLNYSKWKKTAIVIACCWFSIMSLALVGSLGAILGVFFQMYLPEGHSTRQIVWLLTLPSLFVGLGNFLIMPMSLAFGRRPTFLISITCLLAATIGSALQNSFEAHLACRIIQGLCTGATESLLPLMLTDISFLHERSRIFGYYWATQNIFSSALALASSYEATISWRWFYWVYVITISIGLILVIFGGFETRYVRAPTAIDGQVIITDEFGVTRIYSDEEAREHLVEIERIAAESEAHTVQPTKKTYLQMLKPWSPISQNPVRTVLMSYVHMLGAFSSPGIVFSVLLSSIVLGTTIAISLTYDTVLQHYGWPAKSIGLINLGGMIGGFLGMAYAGWPADKFAVWMAKRNNGVHKPEHRLLVLLPPGVLGVASTLLYGFTADGGATWWGPYLGWTLLQVAFTVVLIVTTTFAAEVWPKNPGPAITVVVGSKNIISFAASYGLTPMVQEHGYAWACGVLAGIMGAIFLLTIPVYYFNPLWRKRIS